MLTVFLWASTTIFFILALMWIKKDFFNFFVKAILFLMFIAGTLLLLENYGIIVKAVHA
jgi:hypothetical protein